MSSNTSRENIEELIIANQDRLHMLKLREAREGFFVAPEVVLEIRSIEKRLEELQTELNSMANVTPNQHSVAPEILLEIRNIGEKLEKLQTELKSIAGDTSNQLVVMVISGDYPSLSEDIKTAIIAKVAESVRISTQALELYGVSAGSIVFDFGFPADAFERLRDLVRLNDPQLHSLKIERIVFDKGSTVIEVWFAKDGKFELAEPTYVPFLPTASRTERYSILKRIPVIGKFFGRKVDVPAEWKSAGQLELQKDTLKREPIYGLALGIVQSIFSKELNIFDDVVNAFFSQVDLSPVVVTKNLQVRGMAFGNIGNLGSLQALSFATLVLQQLVESAGDDSISIEEAAQRLSSQPNVQGQLIERAKEIGIDTKTARKLATVAIEIISYRTKSMDT